MGEPVPGWMPGLGVAPAESLGDFCGAIFWVWGCEAAGEPPAPEELCPIATPWLQALCKDCVLSPIVWKENLRTAGWALLL